MSDTALYVTYYVAPQQKMGGRSIFSSQEGKDQRTQIETQQQAVREFIQSQHPPAKVLESFTESPDNRRTIRWPELHKALSACKNLRASLLIAELGTLTSNESFTQMLLDSGVSFHCLDQPFVNHMILEALSKHAKVQRRKHGELIREGLKMTSAKSGNPNAAEVISKVNKPKIDTAIVFAFLLQPIIQDYRRKGYSQRQMVKTLNDEGFTAPEGGKWVLSQLQKVLDRVRLNEIAEEVKPLLSNLSEESKTPAKIAELLNQKGIGALKRGPWDENQAKKLQDRIQQIRDIVLINRFVLDLLPVIHESRKRSIAPLQMLREFQQAGLPIRHEMASNGAAAA